mmetsp:Transcript_544/g.905  ORF Transcript_544/g.905 Transcript_544/m.905 type:complete len:143 (-) Transcript_544:183-611(-)
MVFDPDAPPPNARSKTGVSNDDTPDVVVQMDADKPPEDAQKRRAALGQEERTKFGLCCAKCCWFFCLFGMCGCHRCYLGWHWKGFLMCITLGFCLVGQIQDWREIEELVDMANRGNHVTECDRKCYKVLIVCICIACLLSPV